MTNVQKKVLTAYSPQQMFDLVSDIKRYPEFISSCVEGEVLREFPESGALEARLSFEKNQVKQSFTTRNTLTPGVKIQMDLVDGPFKVLNGCWTFETVKEGCLVGVNLDFEFSNMMYKMMFSAVFQKVIMDLLQAFKNRGDELYG